MTTRYEGLAQYLSSDDRGSDLIRWLMSWVDFQLLYITSYIGVPCL